MLYKLTRNNTQGYQLNDLIDNFDYQRIIFQAYTLHFEVCHENICFHNNSFFLFIKNTKHYSEYQISQFRCLTDI